MSSDADRIAGRASRSVMARNVRNGDEPDASAASSSDESSDVNAAVLIRYATGITWIDWTKTMPLSENTLKIGKWMSRSQTLIGPRSGESKRLHATVLRMPGMISGTSAATRAKAFAGVFVRTTSHARPNPTTVDAIAVDAA